MLCLSSMSCSLLGHFKSQQILWHHHYYYLSVLGLINTVLHVYLSHKKCKYKK